MEPYSEYSRVLVEYLTYHTPVVPVGTLLYTRVEYSIKPNYRPPESSPKAGFGAHFETAPATQRLLDGPALFDGVAAAESFPSL